MLRLINRIASEKKFEGQQPERMQTLTLFFSTKCVASPALRTSRPFNRKPVRERKSPSFPINLERKWLPPTSGKSPIEENYSEKQNIH